MNNGTPVATISVANTTSKEIAFLMQIAGVSGSAVDGHGFGSWGIEPCVLITTDAPGRALQVLHNACPGEEAFYVTHGGKGRCIYRHDITGPKADLYAMLPTDCPEAR